MNNTVSKLYVRGNDIWGLPQKYKDVDFYPIKIKDSSYLDNFYKLFAQPKNYLPVKAIIKMSYLKFILYVIPHEEFDATVELVKFLEYVTKKEVKIESRLIDPNKEITIDNVTLRILIGDVFFDENEFGDIREIVLEQNGSSIDYVEDYIPDLEKKLSQFAPQTNVDYTDELFTFAVVMKKSMQEVGEYTMFQLENQMERLFVLKNYDMLKPLEVSGQIKLNKGGEIKPYLYHRSKRGRYDSIKIDQDKFMEDHREIFK